MAISPQRLTIYLYSAHRHRAVIFAIAQHSFLVSHRAYAVVLRLSPSVCTECIVAKQCVIERKLLLTAYMKSYMRNTLVPK